MSNELIQSMTQYFATIMDATDEKAVLAVAEISTKEVLAGVHAVPGD